MLRMGLWLRFRKVLARKVLIRKVLARKVLIRRVLARKVLIRKVLARKVGYNHLQIQYSFLQTQEYFCCYFLLQSYSFLG